MSDAIYPQLCTLLHERFQLDPAQFSPEHRLEDLGLDSLALMEFVFAVEDHFQLRIPEDQLDPRQAGHTLDHLSTVIAGVVGAAPR